MCRSLLTMTLTHGDYQHNTLNAQEESKTTRVYAEMGLQYARNTAVDSRRMATVGYVGSIFLPPMLTAVRPFHHIPMFVFTVSGR